MQNLINALLNESNIIFRLFLGLDKETFRRKKQQQERKEQLDIQNQFNKINISTSLLTEGF